MVRFDCSFAEHIRLALEITVVIQHFQRAEQEIALVLREGKIVAAAIDQSVFLGEIVLRTIIV